MSFDKSLSAAVFMHQVTKANTQVTTSQRQIHKSLLHKGKYTSHYFTKANTQVTTSQRQIHKLLLHKGK